MNRIAFRHEAMATTFEIAMQGETEEYLRQAAGAAFRELDRLEGELSRFIETSDISRIGRMEAHETIQVGDDAVRCLLDAFQVSAITSRAFDPTYLSRHARGHMDDTIMAIDPESHSITALVAHPLVDLGAVGKGYALDRMAELLREWEVSTACLQAGGSSVLAYSIDAAAADGWSVAVGEQKLRLHNHSVSASGIGVKGRHIVDPRHHNEAVRDRRVWAFATSAAESDALSTAFFVMTDDEVVRFCGNHPEMGAALTYPDGVIRLHGRIPLARA